MCCDQPTIELYRGEALVAALGLHRGQSLRWSGWPTDGRLTSEDARALCGWLERHGVANPCAD